MMPGMRSIRCLLSVLLSVLTLATAAFAQNPPDAPNTILITLDTTRADRMGFLGSDRGLTPNLDALAQESVVFTRAYSQAPLTDVSHATILTGTYPQYHQVLTFPLPLAKYLPYLPDILKAHGYHTGAFVGSLALDPTWGAPGFERGFDKFDAGFSWQKYTPATRYQTTQRRGSEVVERALAWLDQRPPGPFFLWVHMFDAHDPYNPPEPFKTRYAKALYDGGVAYEDFVVGTLLKELKRRGLYDGTAIAITADHGESLGAHGEATHGVFLYDETIHVPLLIKLPQVGAKNGAKGVAKKIDERVELADIMPTLLQSAGIEVPKEVQGESLLPLMRSGPEGEAAAEAWRDKGAYAQADYGHLTYAWSAEQSLRTGKYLYIQAPRRELYDEAVDAGAQHNLAGASPAVADTLGAQLEKFRKETTNSKETPKTVLDAARMRKLAALGYVTGTGDPDLSTSPEKGADPKDKIEVANLLQSVTNIVQDFHCQKAMPALRDAIAKDPNISIFHFYLGGCYMENKEYEKAVPEFRETVKLEPSFTHAQMNLGRTLMELHEYDEAATAFEHVIKSEPNLMDAHVFLVVAYDRLNRVPEEIRECRIVLAAVPEHYGSNLNLGRFLAQSGDLEGAIPSLEKAAALRPDTPVPHLYLADVYTQLGRGEDAARERADAERLGATPRAPLDNAPGNADAPH
jgi:arylsulfatase A-like enzyme/Tfp pilus assembly protein PilF